MKGGGGEEPLDILNLNIYKGDQNPNTESKGFPKTVIFFLKMCLQQVPFYHNHCNLCASVKQD